MILAAIEHRIRTLLAAIDCGIAERARGFSDYEAGDFLDATERARQVLVEREEEEEVAECASLSCPYHGEWCAGETCWWIKSQDSAHAGADPTSATPPAAEVEGPSADSDIPPSPAEGHLTLTIEQEFVAADYLEMHGVGGAGFCLHLIRRMVERINAADAAAAADARIAQRLNAAGYQQGRDFDPPFNK